MRLCDAAYSTDVRPPRCTATGPSITGMPTTSHGSLGTAIFGAVLTSRLDYYLPRLLPPQARARGLHVHQAVGNVGEIRALPASIRSAVLEAFARSFHVIFLTAVPIALAAFGLALLLPERPLRNYTRQQYPVGRSGVSGDRAGD